MREWVDRHDRRKNGDKEKRKKIGGREEKQRKVDLFVLPRL